MQNQAAQISRLELRPAGWEDYVDIWVDGEPLADRLTESQRRLGFDYIFDDTGLGWSHVASAHIETAFDIDCLTEIPTGRLLTVCAGCNVYGCGDMFVDVAVAGGHIAFQNFSTTRGGLDVRPLVFERLQFVIEVQRLNDWYASLQSLTLNQPPRVE